MGEQPFQSIIWENDLPMPMPNQKLMPKPMLDIMDMATLVMVMVFPDTAMPISDMDIPTTTMARDQLNPNPMDIMDMDIMVIPDMDIMVMVLLLMSDALSGEPENKLMLYLQLNKKRFNHILQKTKYKTFKNLK